MAEKPARASGYGREQTERVRATCLYVATKLGDLMDDLVVVGGLVPSLLIDPEGLPPDTTPHVGTLDLDVGLQLALLDEGRYRTLSERLRDAGFRMDTNALGNVTRQRWTLVEGGRVSIDFLVEPSRPGDRGGRLRNLEPDFAAIIAPGLRLAFRDRRRVTLEGRTPFGERARRELWVCGPGAFVALKALAFDGRGENKDAYDLYYVIRNHGTGLPAVADPLRPLLDDADARRAVTVLQRDFLDPDAVGPKRVAAFVAGREDRELQADVAGFVAQLLRLLAS